MHNPPLIPYMEHFRSLKRAHNLGGAPHKPILLLSVAQLILAGEMADNRIRITEELIVAFRENWYRLVKTPHTLNFALPFYHMGSEPFWQLVPYAGMEIELTASRSIKSFNHLRATLKYAWLDQPLFELLQHPDTNRVLTDVLLSTYFPETRNDMEKELPDFLTKPETLIMNDTELVGWSIKSITREQKEELVFIRSGLFKRKVLSIYGNRCIISRLNSTLVNRHVRLLDVCHIRPFSELEVEHPTNGILLTPTLHDAFDAGFITIDGQYRVNVSTAVREDVSSPYALQQFHGKEILLPDSPEFYPSMESLRWHWENRFVR